MSDTLTFSIAPPPDARDIADCPDALRNAFSRLISAAEEAGWDPIEIAVGLRDLAEEHAMEIGIEEIEAWIDSASKQSHVP